MRRRPQDIFAGVLLLLVFPLFWPHLANLVPNLKNLIEYEGISYMFGGPEQFAWVTASLFYILVPFLGLIAAVISFTGRSRGASIVAGLSLISMITATLFQFFSFMFGDVLNYVGLGNVLKSLLLGFRIPQQWVANADNQWFAYAPVTIALCISTILLYSRERESEKPKPAFAFQQPMAAAPQGGQLPYGTKKCPECAELIQADAIKCRFCNYRYS